MLRITIELLPGGNESRAQHKGTCYIANDLSGDDVRGNYKVFLSKAGQPKQVWKQGRVEGFPRKRLGAFDLLFRALLFTVADRNLDDKGKLT